MEDVAPSSREEAATVRPPASDGSDAAPTTEDARADDGGAAEREDGTSERGVGATVDEDRKERAMDEAPVGIVVSDPHREDNPLIYVNEAFERITGYDREDVLGRNCRFLQGEGTDPDTVAELRAGIDEERPVTVELRNYRADGEPFWNEVTVAPIHGDDGELSHFVGFQADVSERVAAQRALAERTRDMERLVDRIDGLLGDVTEVLVGARDRTASQREIVERIASAEPYAAAWIGELDHVADAVAPVAWAGEGEQPDGLAVDRAAEHPTARAYRRDSIQTDDAPTGDLGPATRAGSVAAVPIAYDETTYGVLTVYAAAADAFDQYERVVVQVLGRSLGAAVDAMEHRRALAADDVVEIELSLRGAEIAVVDVSATCSCRLEFRGALTPADGAVSLVLWTDGDPETVVGRAREHDDLEGATSLGGEPGDGLVELRASGEAVVTELVRRGATLEALSVEDGRGRLTITVPTAARPRAVLERVRERYPEAEVLAYRETSRTPRTTGELVADVEERLTDRQRTALRRAFAAGYYEWDRTVSGTELAASMGVSRSTFHQHLRAAERKLIEAFVGDCGGTDRGVVERR